MKAANSEAVDVIFKIYSLGVGTNRDTWVYNFNLNALTENMSKMIDTYSEQVFRWERRADRGANVDDFVIYDDTKIKWTDRLKNLFEKEKGYSKVNVYVKSLEQ